MKHHVDIINDINEIFIERNKGEVSDEEIRKVTNKYKYLLMEMGDMYRCLKTVSINDILINKARTHIKNKIILWRELKLQVTPSAHLLEDHILIQMNYIDGSIADVERRFQVGKR